MQIREIRSRGHLPILVGGTHYYTQSLLFQESQGSIPSSNDIDGTENLPREEIDRRFPILNAPNEEILARLKEVDPVMAERWHPRDRRRLQRSLEIFLLTGRRASDIYDEQRKRAASHLADNEMPGSEQSPAVDGPNDTSTASLARRTPRFPTLILWVNTPAEVLKPRLQKRVRAMLENGLMSEVQTLDRYRHDEASRGNKVDTTRGIWVSIGYKEFEPVVAALKSGDPAGSGLEQLMQEATQRTQTATWQYSKRQIRWIRIKLLHAVSDAGMREQMFVLGGTGNDTECFNDVVESGADLVGKFLAGAQLPSPESVSPLAAELLVPKQDDLSKNPELWVRKTCEVCGTVAVTKTDWTKHVKSRGHRTGVKRKQRKMEGVIEDGQCQLAAGSSQASTITDDQANTCLVPPMVS